MAIPEKLPVLTLMATEAKHVAELNKILTMSVNRLDKEIKALGKVATNPITLMQAQATKAALTSFLDATYDNIEQLIANGVKDAAQAASKVVSQYEDQLLLLVMSPQAAAGLAAAEAQRAAQGIEAALQRMKGNSYKTLSQNVYNSKQLALNWVDKRINQALVSGWSAQKLAGELAGMINPNVKGGVSYAAMRTARTEINNAFHASSAERYLNSPIVEEVDWKLSSSHPEGDVCDSLAADSPYPKKSVPQKPHPQCYCYITPKLPEPAKFLNNLFKGKYGQPPTNAAKTMAAPAAKAGSKAAKNLASASMHAAIKTDPAPTKTSLANRLGLPAKDTGKIVDPESVALFLTKIDDETFKWLKTNSAAKGTIIGLEKDLDDIDAFAAWATKQAKPSKPVPNVDQWDEPLPSGPLKIVEEWGDEDYGELEQFLDPGYVKVLKDNGVNPEMHYNLIEGMDELDFKYYLKIIDNAEINPADNVKFLLNIAELDGTSNSFTGDLLMLAKGQPVKKVPTINSVAESFGIDIKVVQEMGKSLTPDQMVAQIGKLSLDDIADIKKLDPEDQAFYFNKATTPTKDEFPKPTTPGNAPTFSSMAEEYDISETALIDSGATPQQLTVFFEGADGTTGLKEVMKLQSKQMQEIYLSSAKNIDMKTVPNYEQWKAKWGFTADDASDATKGIKVAPTPEPEVIVPKSSYVELEEEYGVPDYVWSDTGLTANEIKATIAWMDEESTEVAKLLGKKMMDAFDEYDQDGVVDAVKAAHKAKLSAKVSDPIVDPETIPKPLQTTPPPPPKELYDSYQDISEIFIKGEFKPNLLKNTGATPQQIADYLEGMNQAQYDYFMSLKWPSQKKHFEKLGAKNNASVKAAEDVIDKGKTAASAKPPKPAATDDPVILAKWRDKPKPSAPQDPPKPKTPGEAAFNDWIDAAQKKFAEFAAKTGNLKNDITKSNNWSYFEKVTKSNDMSALKYLQTNKYIDQKLYDDAVAAMKTGSTPDPDDARAYKLAMEEYAKKREVYDQDLVDWRAANGITSEAKGVWDDVLVHNDNGAGNSWARSAFKNPSGVSKDAIKTYSGSSYSSWNAALRANANGNTVPSGSWATKTAQADAGFSPTPEDVIVRRGTNWDEFFVGGERKRTIPPPPPNDLVGTVQTNHGYISTSVGKTAAFDGQVQMRIRVPQGHPAAYVDPFSSHPNERELLLSRSTEMYIHDVYQVDGQWWVDAEVVPIGEDASVWSPIATALGKRTR